VTHTDVLLYILPRGILGFFFSSAFPFEAENNSQSSTAVERENERLFNCGLLHQVYFFFLFGCALREREREESKFGSFFFQISYTLHAAASLYKSVQPKITRQSQNKSTLIAFGYINLLYIVVVV
jgi:hypothetical protein